MALEMVSRRQRMSAEESISCSKVIMDCRNTGFETTSFDSQVHVQ